MKATQPTLKICSRGHEFYKSKDCQVCPKCWPGYYRKKSPSDFPDKISAPAMRALLNAKITSLEQLTHFTAADLLKLHGLGPSSIVKLQAALRLKGLSFKE